MSYEAAIFWLLLVWIVIDVFDLRRPDWWRP